MASSSNNNFEGSMDEIFDHHFEQAFDTVYNHIGDQLENERKTKKKEFLSKDTVKKAISGYGMIILVTLQHIQKIYSGDDFA